MTPIREFDRRSARVEAMRLDSREDMVAARQWLNAHGVVAAHFPDWSLSIVGDRVTLTARLGQWLAHDPGSGEFTVWDHGDEPGQFGREHDNVGVV